jgi:hypothetical protein
MRASGDVETGSGVGAANNVNSLVETVILNYMALHGQQNQFGNLFPGNSLGNAAALDKVTAFTPICNEVISQPV